MSDTDRGPGPEERDPRSELAPADERLVRRIDALWRAPAPTPERRVAFQRRLDARLEASQRGLGLGRPALVATAVAAAAVLALVAVLAVQRDTREAPEVAVTPSAAAERGEAIYALATEDVFAGGDADLPEEYAAIASLLVD